MSPTYYEMLLRGSVDSRADRFVTKPGDLHLNHEIVTEPGTRFGIALEPPGECPGCDHIRKLRDERKTDD